MLCDVEEGDNLKLTRLTAVSTLASTVLDLPLGCAKLVCFC